MSKTKVAANHYLAEVSQSVDGGGRLGRDFWVAVRDFNRYEPSDITLSQYSQQYHTPAMNKFGANKNALSGLGNYTRLPERPGLKKHIAMCTVSLSV